MANASLKTWWEAESSRRFLWLPVCFAVGIGAYFALPVEPPVWLLPTLALLAMVGAYFYWRLGTWACIALVLITSGAAWASIHTQWQHPVMLHEALTPRPVVGVVSDIERTEHGVRITLEQVRVDDLAPELTPARIRLSVRIKKGTDPELPHIGDGIGMRAGLMPPMGPALPNGFDFARYFYFRGIGAVGYGLPPWQVIAPDNAPTIENQFRNWRLKVTEDIIHTLGTGTGGVAAGLVTGDARAITEDDFNALRASNLYHIIAISGEHMVVIAGVIFISLRLLALLLPTRLALRPQVKSIAAAVTLLLVTAYLFVTGLPISAVRAYVMIVLVLLAVMFRRQVDAMRSLSIAALLMLIYDPSDLFEPGFQLSFAATLAIIALVETAWLRPASALEDSRLRRIGRAVLTMLLISVVAEMATGPLVIAQFNNVSPYGIFANMVATPLVSLLLMPTVAIFFILLPFGLQHWALWVMKFGIEALLGLARWVSGLPHAQLFAPSIPGWGVALFALGLVWVCLWQTTRMRRYGLIAMVLGVLTLFTTHAPDMLIGAGLKQVALRTDDGYALARGRSNAMIAELWANGLGYKELPEAGESAWRCDDLGCVAKVNGKAIAFPLNALAVRDDCARAQAIVTPLSPVTCAQKVTILDGDRLNDNVVALWVGDRVHAETSADWQGKRPWSALEVVDGD